MTMGKVNSQPEAAEDAGVSVVDAAAPTAGQFVIFFVSGETFAVALSEVKEIIRMPAIVRLPLSPSSLEGLANLRGRVLPIVSTRRLFGMDDVEHDDATRIVILDQGQPLGIVVDRVASVVTAERDQIEDASAIEGAIGSAMLQGMIKGLEGFGLVMILNTQQLLDREFGSLGLAATAQRDLAAVGVVTEPSTVTVQPGQPSEELQLVSFEVAGQEYALPIESVQEIVQLPEHMTRVPNVSASVVGVMNLRNRLLPIVSLRGLFALEQSALAEHNRVVVVSPDGGRTSVGLVMDRVNEVLRVGRGGIDPLPAMLQAKVDGSEITAICRLEGGKRLVSILSAEAMFSRAEMNDAVQQSRERQPEARTDTMNNSSTAAVEEEQFVVFRLMSEEYGVSIESVQEIVRVPEQIASVPNTPPFIKGVVNLRGTVIPLIDQRSRFGLPPCEPNDRQRIVVFTVQGIRTGFIVDSVSEVMRIPLNRIGAAPDMSEDMRRIIRRVANLTESKRMILLLDTEQMLDKGEMNLLQRAA